jgi:hypothetical protein
VRESLEKELTLLALRAKVRPSVKFSSSCSLFIWRAFVMSRVHLLPGFDEYLLGYKDRTAVLTVGDAPKVVPGKNGVFLPTIVVGGRVVGTWKRRLNKNSIDITLSPFTRLGDSEGRAIEAAKSYGDFVGLPLSSGARR